MNIALEKNDNSVDGACDIMKAMANRHRFLILHELSKHERSVGELADFLGISDSTVSQHLAVLRGQRIVFGRRDGQTVWYRLEKNLARTIVAMLVASSEHSLAPSPQAAREPDGITDHKIQSVARRFALACAQQRALLDQIGEVACDSGGWSPVIAA